MRDVLRALAPYVSLALHRSFTCRPYLTEFQKSQNWGLRHGRTSRIFLSCAKAQPSAAMQSLGCRLMAGQRILVPSMGVRLPPSQPLHLLHMARSSSGLGRRPLKAEITSSNLVRATKHLIPELLWRFGFFIASKIDRQKQPLFFRRNAGFAFCLRALRVQ